MNITLPKNLFFDFDGTIADTSEGIIKSMHYAFDKLHLGELSDERMRTLIGPTLEEIFEILTGNSDEEFLREAVKTFRERYSVQGVKELCLYPGVEETLRKLCDDGHKLYIVTSKPELFTKQICEEHGILKYFAGVTGTATDKRSLTKAERMGLLMEAEGISRDDVVMVGDRPEDARAAKANDVRCIGAAFGFGQVDELLACGCVEVIDAFDELK